MATLPITLEYHLLFTIRIVIYVVVRLGQGTVERAKPTFFI